MYISNLQEVNLLLTYSRVQIIVYRKACHYSTYLLGDGCNVDVLDDEVVVTHSSCWATPPGKSLTSITLLLNSSREAASVSRAREKGRR